MPIPGSASGEPDLRPFSYSHFAVEEVKALISKKEEPDRGPLLHPQEDFSKGTRDHVKGSCQRETRRQGMRMWGLGSEVDGAWGCQVRMDREAGRVMTLQSSAPPEHSSLCLSDVCAGSLHDVQDSEMCTNPFPQEGLVGWEGVKERR